MKTRKPQIALNLPTVVALLLIYVRHVIEMMTKNVAMFSNPGPTPALADVTKHADDLEAAEVAARTRAKGAVQERDDKKLIVHSDMILLKAYVYALAAANLTNAATIIHSAGMSEKHLAHRIKAQFEALMGAAPHEVLLRARAEKKRAAYEWYYSADSGKTWVFIGATPEANITVQDLTAGTTYQFRYRTTVKGVTGPWSDVVSLSVS